MLAAGLLQLPGCTGMAAASCAGRQSAPEAQPLVCGHTTQRALAAPGSFMSGEMASCEDGIACKLRSGRSTPRCGRAAGDSRPTGEHVLSTIHGAVVHARLMCSVSRDSSPGRSRTSVGALGAAGSAASSSSSAPSEQVLLRVVAHLQLVGGRKGGRARRALEAVALDSAVVLTDRLIVLRPPTIRARSLGSCLNFTSPRLPPRVTSQRSPTFMYRVRVAE